MQEQLKYKNKYDLIPESGEVYLFRSCTINSLYPGVEAATRKSLKILGFTILTSDEQTCCTDPLYYSNLENDLQMTTIMARNLSIVENLHIKNIITECNGCFATLTHAVQNLKKPEIRMKVEEILSKINYKVYDDFTIIHILELYYKILPKILKYRKIDLSGLKIASHYGCNYLRTHPENIITNPLLPDLIEKIVEKCGGTPTLYTERDCCCGAGIIQRNINPDLSLEVSYQKMRSLAEVEPDLIVTICPFCMSTLENCQFSLEVEKDLELSIPVLHISELIAIILGFDPISDLALNSHKINPLDILKNLKPIS
ncbi:MAG: heterodisulfide reductase-related iron-sulfur binding cluster [Candidatus Helarchaeota archaeon]